MRVLDLQSSHAEFISCISPFGSENRPQSFPCEVIKEGWRFTFDT